MGFLGLFKLKLFNPEEFERDLTSITQSISKVRGQVQTLTRKRRTYTRNLLWYGAAIYLSYIAFRYKVALGHLGPLTQTKSRVRIFISGQLAQDWKLIITSPIAGALVVYICHTLFTMIIRSKESTLKSLSKQHKKKLEELKVATNFQKTNQILTKFDIEESSSNGYTNDKSSETKRARSGKSLPTKANDVKRGTLSTSSNAARMTGPVASQGQREPKRTLLDMILDYFIGSEHNESVESRYALICANCYTHNGLAPPNSANPNEVTYICRNCGFINGQLNSNRAGTANVTKEQNTAGREVKRQEKLSH